MPNVERPDFPGWTRAAAAFVAAWVASLVVAAVQAPIWVGLAVTAMLCGVLSLQAKPGAAIAVAVLGWAFLTGFEVNRHGVLTLTSADLSRLALVAAVALATASWPRPVVRLRPARLPDPNPAPRPGSGGFDARSLVRPAHRGLLRRDGVAGQGGGAAVSAENVVGLVLSAALFGYLVLALLFPERF